MAFHGNLQVAIREAKTLLEARLRLAFFAPTAGEVERLADVFSEYSVPYQIDLGGEQVPEYLRRARAVELSAGVALIRGDVARGTVFQEAPASRSSARKISSNRPRPSPSPANPTPAPASSPPISSI